MAKDIENTADGDIMVNNTKGVVFRDDAEEQLIMKLMYLNKGSLKHSLMTGAGIRNLPNARTGQEVIKNIELQLEADGWNEVDIAYDGKKLEVFANRNL